MSTNEQNSLSFRLTDVARVMQALRSNQTCALLGVNGVGKTSFLHDIRSEPVRQQFLDEQFQRFTFLLLDAREFGALEITALAYIRQMVFLLQHLLLASASALDLASEPQDEAAALQLLFAYAEALARLDEPLMVVFCFDDFEQLLRRLDTYFLDVLLALRQRAARRIIYVATASNGPELLFEQPKQRNAVSERFRMLFGNNVWGLRPFGQRDAQALLERHLPALAPIATRPLERIGQFLLKVTGSHPALLQAVIDALVDGDVVLSGQENMAQVLQKLLDDAAIRNRCWQLWQSLSGVEQSCLKYVQQDELSRSQLLHLLPEPLVNATLSALILKGVCLTEDEHTYRCFSPLLTAYITRLFASRVQGIQLDPENRQVYIDGKPVPRRLSRKEMRLLQLLASDPGRVFRREETTWEIYGEKYAPRRDDERLDALVERTRRHIGDSSREPRFLETLRGSGHRLNEYLGRRSSRPSS